MKPSFRVCSSVAMVAGVLYLAGCTTLSPEAQTAALIAQAETALGSALLKTLTITGRGTGASVGQAHAPGMPWPTLQVRALSRMATPQRYTDPNFMKENFQRLYSEDPGPSHEHVSKISAPTMRGYFYQLMAMWTGEPLRRQPDNLRWNYRGVWSDKLEGRELLDAWRRVLDREEPEYRN